MKTLIINGSPRKNGDTQTLINEFKKHISGEVIVVSAYHDKISACTDCRACWKKQGCTIDDDMSKVYADDYDVFVIASPVYMFNLTGPLMSLASRFQMYYSAKRFLDNPIARRKKSAVLLLVAGGDGGAWPAIESAKLIFKIMNAAYDETNTVLSLKTDELPAKDDVKALGKAREAALRMNELWSADTL